MKEIIKAQNAVIAGLISLLLLTIGFFGAGMKAFLFSMMSFLLINQALWELAKMYLRRKKRDGKHGKGANIDNIVSGVAWHEVRYRKAE